MHNDPHTRHAFLCKEYIFVVGRKAGMSVWCVFLAWSPSLNRVWGEVATRRNGADKLYGNMEGRIVSVELYGCIRDTLAYAS